jgi:hypothetical protein
MRPYAWVMAHDRPILRYWHGRNPLHVLGRLPAKVDWHVTTIARPRESSRVLRCYLGWGDPCGG